MMLEFCRSHPVLRQSNNCEFGLSPEAFVSGWKIKNLQRAHVAPSKGAGVLTAPEKT